MESTVNKVLFGYLNIALDLVVDIDPAVLAAELESLHYGRTEGV